MVPGMELVVIYTDGACSGNPGPGGWGAVMRTGEREREIMGGEGDTTNNRMEMMAAIKALEALKRPCRVRLHTDSTYLCNGITRWITAWKAKGWKTSARKPVKNVDLWQRLEAAMEPHDTFWCLPPMPSTPSAFPGLILLTSFLATKASPNSALC